MKLIYSLSLFIVLSTTTSLVAYGDETSEIKVTPTGEPVIDLDSSNKLFRMDIEVINYDPSDGNHIMEVTQLHTQKIVLSTDIFVKDLSNGQWGTKVAYLLDEYELGKDGKEITGEYEIQIKTEFGTAVGKTNFSVIKSSESELEPAIEGVVVPESEKGVETSQELESNFITDDQLKIPEWVRNVFIWYAEDNISESELLAVIQVLIQQGIVIV